MVKFNKFWREKDRQNSDFHIENGENNKARKCLFTFQK